MKKCLIPNYLTITFEKMEYFLANLSAKRKREHRTKRHGDLFLSSGYEKDGFAVLIDGFELS